MTTEIAGKELVWITADLKNTLENLDECMIDQLDLKKVIYKLKNEVDIYTDDFEDSVATFRRQSKRIKDKIKEVVDGEVQSMYEFWEEQETKRSEITQKLNGLKDKIRSTKDDIVALKKLTESIHVYGIENLINLIDKIKDLPERDKNLLAHVFDYGKRQ